MLEIFRMIQKRRSRPAPVWPAHRLPRGVLEGLVSDFAALAPAEFGVPETLRRIGREMVPAHWEQGWHFTGTANIALIAQPARFSHSEQAKHRPSPI